MNKLALTLQSRKFWFTVIVMAGAAGMFALGIIDGDGFLWAISIAGSVYVGALALTDGASEIAKSLRPIIESWVFKEIEKRTEEK